MQEHTVIIGGGYAGVMAAARLARRGRAVTLVDANDGLTERIRLHQVLAGDDVAKIPFARLFRKLPVDVVRARVTAIDRERKRVVTTDGTIDYNTLVYALGSRDDAPAHALSVGNPYVVREKLRDARSVTIVGGGATGIETAAELATRHPQLRVTLVDAGVIGANLTERASRYLRTWFDEHRVTLLEQTRVAEGERIESDVVLWCASFSMSPIAREAGLRVNARGQIVVDAHLRSSDPSIYAAGDAAAFRDVRMGCATAMPMGVYVADVIAGATREPFRFAFTARCLSLGREHGLVQFTRPDDTPRETFLSGRAGAWVKELICRFTVLAVKAETMGIAYQWPKENVAA